MRKNSVNNILLVIGLLLVFVVTPLSVVLITPTLAETLCVSQNLKGTEICLPNAFPAIAITLAIPLVIGAILLIISVVKRK